MKFENLHEWGISPKEAIALQRELGGRLILHDDFGEIKRVAGVDCGFEENGKVTRAAVSVLDYPSLAPVEEALARLPTSFPYVPGLLSFRECPAVLAALEKLKTLPDLLLVDGQGYAHPRRMGIASHLGLLTGFPSIGVAKTRLIGTHDEPPESRGAWAPLMDGDERIGAVLRTRERVKPLYISAGHKISLESAIDWVMNCTTKYRLPETTRRAHKLASG